MKKYGLVSQYTVKQFKVHKAKCNEVKIANKVNGNRYSDEINNRVYEEGEI